MRVRTLIVSVALGLSALTISACGLLGSPPAETNDTPDSAAILNMTQTEPGRMLKEMKYTPVKYYTDASGNKGIIYVWECGNQTLQECATRRHDVDDAYPNVYVDSINSRWEVTQLEGPRTSCECNVYMEYPSTLRPFEQLDALQVHQLFNTVAKKARALAMTLKQGVPSTFTFSIDSTEYSTRVTSASGN